MYGKATLNPPRYDFSYDRMESKNPVHWRRTNEPTRNFCTAREPPTAKSHETPTPVKSGRSWSRVTVKLSSSYGPRSCFFIFFHRGPAVTHCYVKIVMRAYSSNPRRGFTRERNLVGSKMETRSGSTSSWSTYPSKRSREF